MDPADLYYENRDMRFAITDALDALRHARDGQPEIWDALMGTESGVRIAQAWDRLRPWHDPDTYLPQISDAEKADHEAFHEHLKSLGFT